MLLLEGVRKNFAGRPVIASASLRAAAGEVLCLKGPSGVGKSTLLEIMAGVIEPDGGGVTRNGAVALAFQDDALIPWLDAAANVAYVLPPALPRPEREARGALWLERFGLEANVYPAAMSGGMRRRLNMARAFASERPILLLDEPFAFLDEGWQQRIADLIGERAAQGGCIVLSSHTLDPLTNVPHRSLAVEDSPVLLQV